MDRLAYSGRKIQGERNLMKWFLLAFIVYAETGQMDVKFNTALRFDNLDDCQTYVKETKPILEKGIRGLLPEIKELVFRCVSGEEAQELREKMLEDDEKEDLTS